MATPRAEPAASDPEVDGFLALLAARRGPKTVDAYRRDLRALGDWPRGPPAEGANPNPTRGPRGRSRQPTTSNGGSRSSAPPASPPRLSRAAWPPCAPSSAT